MSIVLKGITKTYGKNNNETKALNDISIKIDKGELVAIMGQSGCGKSTLLNIIGCIDSPNTGEYYLNDKIINFKNLNSLHKIRNSEISFIFQNFALIKEFSVLENVLLPLKFRKESKKEQNLKARKYLEKVDMISFMNKKVSDLSGGQQQRVAIARALIQESNIILADEPTGSLDKKNGKEVMDILCNLNKEGKTILIVTHDEKIASLCKRIIQLDDGKVI